MFKWKAVKRSYGKPWAKLTGRDFADRAFLDRVGAVLLREVIREAKLEAASESKRPIGIPSEEAGMNTTPAGIPKDPKFYESFNYRIVGQSTLEIYSTWPWIDLVIKGKEPYSLAPKSGTNEAKVVPFSDPSGKVIFRTRPGGTQDAWIHPGFAPHSFMQRAFKKARVKIKSMYAQQAKKVLSKNRPL
jgi:hypothetical protein